MSNFYHDLIQEIDQNEDDIDVINKISTKYDFLDFRIIDNEVVIKNANFSQGKKDKLKFKI